ncbi:MAG TPA: response regulator, partial [Thermoanaerobaculia bacterium]|nr:response regulator [Thermoanaerobaculia bacterium]
VTIDIRRSTREPERVEVEIRDSGTGMSAEVLDRIFDPLFTTKNGATGLGLSSALQAMVLQEGTIRVSSQPGSGSAFTLVFHESTPPPQLVVTSSGVRERRKKILLVEDDEAVGEGLRMLLTDDGFEVRLVTCGSAAGEAANEFSPDVTVLDVNLGDMSGLDVFEVLRRDHPDLPVIFSTGHADAAALDDVRRRRVPAIMKPYEIGDLVAIIEQLGQPATANSVRL